MGEFDLITQITAPLGEHPSLRIGVGDDAAVFRAEGETAVSTDLLIEDVHFRRAWSSARDVGRKAVAVNVSDVEAMGARPTGIVIGLAFPAELDQQWVLDFSAGVREECERAGVALAGGDLSRANQIMICGTSLGVLPHDAVTRAGARAGDVVAVCGKLGWAAAGLAALQRGFRSPAAAIEEQRCPSVPYGQGRLAAQAGATAMIDVSDGLLQDLGHIARRSGVSINLETALFEVPDVVQRVASATGKAPWGFVLAGGEDHALAAAFPAVARLPEGWSRIGTVNEGEAVTVDGEPWDDDAGWDHFR